MNNWKIYLIWLVVALVMFDWGYTSGGYQGYETQASFGRFECIPNRPLLSTTTQLTKFEECLTYQQKPLHQFIPFPYNIEEALGRIHSFGDLMDNL